MQTDVLIVGGGLSGLCVAHLLSVAGIDFRLIEARNRLGGRILSLPTPDGSENDEGALEAADQTAGKVISASTAPRRATGS
jgi:monoamine oxidase